MAGFVALGLAEANGCQSDLRTSARDASVDSTSDTADSEGGTIDSPVHCEAPCTYTLEPTGPNEPFWVARTSLECLCATDSSLGGCPAATLSEALALIGSADVSLSCAPVGVCPVLVRGCGVVSVGRDGLGGFFWHYDEASGNLIGAQSWDDIAFGPCGAVKYTGGLTPSCSTSTRCNPCPEAVPNDANVGYCGNPCP